MKQNRPVAKIDVLAAERKKDSDSTNAGFKVFCCRRCNAAWESISRAENLWNVYTDFPKFRLKKKLCPKCAK